jgi:hypothetical protein
MWTGSREPDQLHHDAHGHGYDYNGADIVAVEAHHGRRRSLSAIDHPLKTVA